MTHEEMEQYEQRRTEMAQVSDSGQRNRELIELRTTIGAGGWGSGSVGEQKAEY